MDPNRAIFCALSLTLCLLPLGCGSAEVDEADDVVGDPTTDSPDDDGDDAAENPPFPKSICGDGLAGPGEDCDGYDLNGWTCGDIDPRTTAGYLACTADCMLDTSGCRTVDNIRHCETVGQTIPDSNPLGVTHTIDLPLAPAGRVVTDVDIEVEIEHSYLSDLIIEVAHSGKSVRLLDSCGGADLHATFDDEAGTGQRCPGSQLAPVLEPVGQLADFDGDPVEASWELSVRDRAAFDIGVLERWCVSVSWF